MTIEIKNKVSGELRFTVYRPEDIDPNGNPIGSAKPKLDTGFNPQLITDFFFDQWVGGSGTATALTSFIQCGTGTATPSASDVSITPLGPRAGIFSRNYSTSSNEITCTTEFRFAQGAVIGTVSEVGVFASSTGGSTTMRSLIKDLAGIPTTITLTSIDYLYITWRVKSTVSLSDQIGTITIGGVNYNYTIRPCTWNSNVSIGSNFFSPLNSLGYSDATSTAMFYTVVYGTQTLGSVTGQPSEEAGFSYLPSTALSLASYTSGSKQRKLTWFFADSQANIVGGIGSIMVFINSPANGGGYQVSFSAVSGGGKIPKDNTKTFTFSLTFTWSR